jgi:hypothetical protein
MHVRQLVNAGTLFLLVFGVGCAGGSVAQLPGTAPSTVSGIYNNPSATPPVLEAADISFLFNVSGNSAQGAVFIMPEGGYETQQPIYEAPLTFSRFSSDGPITQVAGQANLGSDLGTFAVSGTIVNGMFTYTYTDALESGSDAATYLAAIQPTLAAAESGSPYVGTWTLSLPDLALRYVGRCQPGVCYNLSIKGPGPRVYYMTECSRPPPNPLGASTTLKVTVASVSADKLGFGLAFSGTASGSIPYVPLPPSGVYELHGEALPGGVLTLEIGPEYIGTYPDGRITFVPTGWSPPAAAQSVEWRGDYGNCVTSTLYYGFGTGNYLGP